MTLALTEYSTISHSSTVLVITRWTRSVVHSPGESVKGDNPEIVWSASWRKTKAATAGYKNPTYSSACKFRVSVKLSVKINKQINK